MIFMRTKWADFMTLSPHRLTNNNNSRLSHVQLCSLWRYRILANLGWPEKSVVKHHLRGVNNSLTTTIVREEYIYTGWTETNRNLSEQWSRQRWRQRCRMCTVQTWLSQRRQNFVECRFMYGSVHHWATLAIRDICAGLWRGSVCQGEATSQRLSRRYGRSIIDVPTSGDWR